MKKIFYGIGFIIFLFSTLQFFLVTEQKMAFANDEKAYILNLECFITGGEVEELAKENSVTLYTRECISEVFGKVYYKFKVFNAKDDILTVEETSLFGTAKRKFEKADIEDNQRIQQLFIFENDKEIIERVYDAIEDRGIKYDCIKLASMKMSGRILKSESSIKFLILIELLSVIAIASYYVFRLKEIGIKRLNGMPCNSISWGIMRGMIIRMCMGWGIPMILLGIWIIQKDFYEFGEYVIANVVFIICQTVVYVIGHLGATVYLYRVSYVTAIKNKRNNKFIFRILIAFKMIIVVLLFMDINNLQKNFVYNKDVKTGYEMVKDSELYVMSQHVFFEEKEYMELCRKMDEIPNEEIFTYITYPDDEYYSSREIKQLKKTGKKFNIDNVIICSNEMLKKLNVKDIIGKKIERVELEKNRIKYLVPEGYKYQKEQIKKYYKCKNEDILFIADGQYFMSYSMIAQYWYDPIICVCNVQKNPTSDTYLTSKGKKMMEKILVNSKLGSDSISITSLEEKNRVAKHGNDFELLYILINVGILVVSYLMVSMAIFVVYFELNKKTFGVNAILGKIPMFEIMYILIINVFIIGIIACCMDKNLIIFGLFEVIGYFSILEYYLRKKAVLVIKGE